jgi:hypothetical protein
MMPQVTMHNHVEVRKHKRGLYLHLLKRGFDNLTDSEKKILEHLAMDKDIHLLLKHGVAFEEEK